MAAARVGRALLYAALVARASAQAAKAVARIRAADGTTAISGTVTFEQSAALGDMTVKVDVTGLKAGQHGFHVHQFGDVRKTTDLSTMSAHFVPLCTLSIVVKPGERRHLQTYTSSCSDDQKHGLPPSQQRQPGDMGNLDGGATTSQTLTLGQQKMSLSDPLRSVVGRTVLIHANPDDGTQPYGNAGPPYAYGVIGIAAGTPNAAQAPQRPPVDKVICTFEMGTGTGAGASIGGSALLTMQEYLKPGVVRFQARLTGMKKGATHSFHFHEYGDMTVGLGAGSLGAIYNAEGIVVESLSVNSLGVGLIDLEFPSKSLLQHVGRSLTIHSGADKSSETIAAAACGLANPRAKLDTTGIGKPLGLSSRTLALGACFVGVSVLVILIAVLHRKGVIKVPGFPQHPAHERRSRGYRESVPPPPPPPSHGSEMAGNKV